MVVVIRNFVEISPAPSSDPKEIGKGSRHRLCIYGLRKDWIGLQTYGVMHSCL
jgi:hypothetical protein